jgi:multidrug resistance efflux pump
MNRWVKVAAGVALAGTGAYIAVGEQMAGVSADAVINAQVVTVRAPVDGVLELTTRRLGTRVAGGERLGMVADPRPDETRLVDLRRARVAVQGELRRLEDLSQELEASRAAYQLQSQTFSAGRVQQLDARLAEAMAALEAAQARLRESEATMRRATDLSRSGIQTAAEFNRARAGFEVGGQDVEAARYRVRYLSVEREVARNGVFLGDGTNDAPSSQQRVRELDQRLGELAAEMRERGQRLKLLDGQIDEERVRLALFREGQLTAPAPGMLWEVMTGEGEYVRRAQDLLRLVDCTTIMVTASVREAVYNRLSIGDPVRFRLLGDGRVFEGAVARLAGSGAETIYRSLAVGPSQEHLKRYDVALIVPALAADPVEGCAIGRTGRAIFAARPLDWWRRLAAQFGLG